MQEKGTPSWIPTKLPIKGNKKRAEAVLLDMRQNYILPASAAEKSPHEEINKALLFTDFLQDWLRVAKSTVAVTTYASYGGLMRSAILPHFEKQSIQLKDLTPKHIQDFYTSQLEHVSAMR